MKTVHKKIISLFLAVVMFLTSMSVSLFAFAVDDFTAGYDFQIYYYDENNEFVEVTKQVEVMEQYEVQLYACLVYGDGTVWNITQSGMPSGMENYSLDWTSDARYLAFCCNNDGNVRGYDATKGEAIRNWLDAEVATIPVVGESLKKTILALLDNDVTDIDDLDTEDVIKIVNGVLESMGLQEYEEQLDASIAEYLNKFDVGITATLKDENGEAVASDTVRVLVLKSDELLSDVVPNAAFIKNHDSIPTTVAVGYEMDLEGIITPVRTHYSCTWTVTGKYGVLGSDLATVDENGHFTALSEGEVQVKVSPDINGLTQKITDAFNAFGSMGDLIDNESIAKALLLILGIKEGSDNYTTLVSIVTKILESGVTVDGTIQFTQENLAPLVNFILYVMYQDTVSIKIVAPEDIPITSYELSGNFSVNEGESSTLSFVNVKPDGAVAHDYILSIENEEYAVMTDSLTFMGIDGSTWNNNYVTSNKTKLICRMDGIENSYDVSVWGKDNEKVVYIKIGCDEYLDVETATPVNASTYPKRLEAMLTYGWIKEDGTYIMATDEQPAYTEDGLAYVTSDGTMYSTGCTVNTLVVQEANGAVATKQIMSGVQTTGVQFTKDHFWKKCNSGTISTGIRGAECEVSAEILPANASYNTLTFESADTEKVILSSTPLTTTQYTSAAMTQDRRASHKTATVECDENGRAVVYAYAIGNTSCYADITVSTQTGGFTDNATVAYANLDVLSVTITAEESDFLVSDNYYEVTAGDQIHFNALVTMSEEGSWKNQGFEDVEWSISDDNLASISGNGIFTSRDVGTVTVTATSVFEEMSESVTIKILPNYNELRAAMAECDYDNLSADDWSYDSWNSFNNYYQEAVSKLSDNSFVSQREVDTLTENIRNSFSALVRYLPITGIDISCSDDADGNGFAQISVGILSNYTNYSTTIVPTVYPAEAEDYRLTYTSSNPDMITVDDNGKCTPVSSSDAAYSKITVTVTDPKNGNEFSKEMYVAFAKYQVTSVSVSPDDISFVGVGEDAEKANETIIPKYNMSSSVTTASIKHGFFVSSDENVAIVDDNGLVTPVSIGNCIITFYSYDGGYSAITNVTVSTNRSSLKSAIDIAESVVEEFYTEESFAALSQALESAKTVYEDMQASQQDINNSTSALNEAINNLVKNPYANVYLSAGVGGSIVYDSNTYTGENNKVRVLIENGITVSAVADEGYHFVSWKDDKGNVISEDETGTFSIDYSSGFYAVFEKVNSITGIRVFADGNDTQYYTVTVSALSNYTNSSAMLTYEIIPSDASFFKVEYKTDSETVVISDDGTVKPKENQTCYAVIDAVATNTITGEQFTDTVTVAFVKYALQSVSADPDEIIFTGTNAEAQQINITYSASSSVYTPSLRRGFFESDNENIASVDSNGLVTPVNIGSCNIKFTAYDGGYTANISVKVVADKSVLQEVLTQSDAINSSDYTSESYSAFVSAAEYAREINDKEFASQSEVDSAASALTSAINALEKRNIITINVLSIGEGYAEINGEKALSIDVERNALISLNAVADEGYEFEAWYDENDNIISTDISFEYTASEAKTIKVKFKQINYIEKVVITYDGNETDFASVNVLSVANYTRQSASFDVNVYPSNADYTVVGYSLGNPSNNMSITGSTVNPSSNNPAYAQVIVTVRDNKSGITYTDDLYVAFAKNQVKSVSVSPTSMSFDNRTSPAQTITVSYTGPTSITAPNINTGFFVSSDENVASVDSDGAVTPENPGNCIITFYSYDGGKTAETYVSVGGKVSLSGKVVMMISPEEDSGTIPVSDAVVTVGSQTAKTDSNGEFIVTDLDINSTYDGTVTHSNGVTRNIKVITANNDKTDVIIPIIAVDRVNDGIINVKDLAMLRRDNCSDEVVIIFRNFLSTRRYNSSFYNDLVL